MLLLLAQLKAKTAARGEVKTILKKLVASTQDEAGNIFYAVHQQQDQPNNFMVYELYRDQAACDVHLQSEPVMAALQRMEALLENSPVITFCDTLAHTSMKA